MNTTNETKECVYPDWLGGYFISKEHAYDNDGYCSICGHYNEEEVRDENFRAVAEKG